MLWMSVVDLLVPTLIDGFLNNLPAILRNISNEKNTDVVFNSDQLGIVNARLSRKPLTIFGEVNLNGLKS